MNTEPAGEGREGEEGEGEREIPACLTIYQGAGPV